jgi:hypothetical protein
MRRQFPLVDTPMLVVCLSGLVLLTTADPPKTLTADDKKFLDGLMAEFLFDPKGAERVRFGDEDFPRTGWRVKGKRLEKDRVYFTDGYSVPAPDLLEKDDLVEAYRAWKKSQTLPDSEYGTPETKRLVRQYLGAYYEPKLALAAWMYRLGHEDYAAECLAEALEQAADFDPKVKKDEKLLATARTELRTTLAWLAFREMIDWYEERNDAEAIARGERILKLYPEFVDGEDKRVTRQVKTVLAELKRRKAQGKNGKEPAKYIPLALWKDTPKKIAWLVDALDEVDIQQNSSPGGVDLGDDWRVKALIAIGDAAVPTLIDVIEKDDRLTHSVHYWRDYDPRRTVLSVREAALVAVMSILRVQVFDPAFTGDNFTSRGEATHKETAAQLRKYWAVYGKFPFDERMMRILTDPTSSGDACEEAAANLAALGGERVYGTTVWTGRDSGRQAGTPNPAIAKFKNPTAAEAILAVLDRDLKAFDAKPDPHDPDRKRRGILGSYLSSLGDLGDSRIGPTLANRAGKATTLPERRMYAIAAFDCGAKEPIRLLANEVKAGTLKLPNDGGRTWEGNPAEEALYRLVRVFLELRTAESDAALTALADPKHPYRAVVVRAILNHRPNADESNYYWYDHPFALTVLRQLLDDPKGRVCDEAAIRLSEMVVGLQISDFQTREDDDHIRQLKKLFDQLRGSLKSLPDDLRTRWGVSPFGKKYYLAVTPLEKPATAADVTAGRAVFHLDGKGTILPVKPNTWVVLKTEAKKDNPPQGLVVQAEKNEKGEVTYGVIFRHAIRAVPAADVYVVPENKPDQDK